MADAPPPSPPHPHPPGSDAPVDVPAQEPANAPVDAPADAAAPAERTRRQRRRDRHRERRNAARAAAQPRAEPAVVQLSERDLVRQRRMEFERARALREARERRALFAALRPMLTSGQPQVRDNVAHAIEQLTSARRRELAILRTALQPTTSTDGATVPVTRAERGRARRNAARLLQREFDRVVASLQATSTPHANEPQAPVLTVRVVHDDLVQALLQAAPADVLPALVGNLIEDGEVVRGASATEDQP